MGIQKLMDFIKKQSPQAVRVIGPHNIRNKTLAIDASNTMYQFMIKTLTMSQNSNSAVNMPYDF